MSELLLLTILFLLRSPWVEGASNFHRRNHTGALFLYAFDNGQVPTSPPAFVSDRLGLDLMGNLSTSTTGTITWSVQRQGISVPSTTGGMRAVSQQNASALLNRLRDEFSFEVFFSSPTNPLSQSLLIAGFGNWPPNAAYVRCNASLGGGDGGWRLSSFLGNVIELEAVVLVDGVPTCESITISIQPNQLQHLVVRVQRGELSIVSELSNSDTLSPTLRLSPSSWARHVAPFALATPHVSTGWTGSIYLTAMYDRYLSNAEIAANRGYGPPNSLPACAVSALTALEDGSLSVYP